MLEFAADRLRLGRLSAYFYPDNQPALRAAEKLGFEREGVLRGYLRERGGSRQDLVVGGLLLDPAFFAGKARVRQRLLGRGSRRCWRGHLTASVGQLAVPASPTEKWSNRPAPTPRRIA